MSLHVDISKAHRRCPVEEKDWGRQGCQIKGSATAAALEGLVRIAEVSKRIQVTQGNSAALTPRTRAKPEDLPDHILVSRPPDTGGEEQERVAAASPIIYWVSSS